MVTGDGTLFMNARSCVDAPEVIAIDEGKSKSTSPSNRHVSFTPQKPIRKGVENHYAACSLQNHSGYMLACKPHCKDYNVQEDVKLDEEEGNMDNLIHQLIL